MLVYCIALSIIVLSLLSSSFLMQYVIKSSDGDSRVINLSGRQRMLSQYLTKSVMALERPASFDERIRRSNEIKESFVAWKTAHIGLQRGDATIGLPQRVNSLEVQALFNEIEPYHATMVKALDRMMSVPSGESPVPSVVRTTADVLLINEPRFLRLMDKITFQFDKEAKERNSSMQRLELLFIVAGLLILTFEFFCIFRPSSIRITELMSSLENKRERLKEKNEQLQKSLDNLKLTEQALQQSAAIVSNSEQFMKKLIDIIPGMVGYWNSDLRCSFANKAYQEWFGKSREQMSGITIREMMGDELFCKNEPFITAGRTSTL